MAGLAIVKAQAECARLQAVVEMLTAKDPDAALQDQVTELWRRVDRAEADRAASQEREAKSRLAPQPPSAGRPSWRTSPTPTLPACGRWSRPWPPARNR